MNRNCCSCMKQDSCPKAKHIENYRMKTNCSEFKPDPIDTLTELFSDLQKLLDNRSVTETVEGEISPRHFYEGQLEDDINWLKQKYLGWM